MSAATSTFQPWLEGVDHRRHALERNERVEDAARRALQQIAHDLALRALLAGVLELELAGRWTVTSASRSETRGTASLSPSASARRSALATSVS